MSNPELRDPIKNVVPAVGQQRHNAINAANEHPASLDIPEPTSLLRSAGSKAGAAVSVISGWRYFRKAGSQAFRTAKLPFVKRTYQSTRAKIQSTKEEPQIVAAEDLPDDLIRTSLISHLWLLAFFTSLAFACFYYFVHSLGLLLLKGLSLAEGNYGFALVPILSVFIYFRIRMSYKSLVFFREVRRMRIREAQNV